MTPPPVPAFIAENKAQTRSLLPVVILTIEGPDAEFPVVGCIKRKHGWMACSWRSDGSRDQSQEVDFDLVPLAPEQAGKPIDLTPAKKSAAKFLIEYFTPRKCDNPAVGCCVRCSALALARWTLQDIAKPAPESSAPKDAVALLRRCVAAGIMSGPLYADVKAFLDTTTGSSKGQETCGSAPIPQENAGFDSSTGSPLQPAAGAREWDVESLLRSLATDCSYHGSWAKRLLEVREVAANPSPAGNAASTGAGELPEGVPPLTGEFAEFDYLGVGPVRGHDSARKAPSGDVSVLDRGLWRQPAVGNLEECHYAIRRGTELHRLNFAEPAEAGEWRYFADADSGEMMFKLPANKADGFVWHLGAWEAGAVGLGTAEILIRKGALIETDASGKPLP
jgi:hypothetical protein